jgi:hypothetical protein
VSTKHRRTAIIAATTLFGVSACGGTGDGSTLMLSLLGNAGGNTTPYRLTN